MSAKWRDDLKQRTGHLHLLPMGSIKEVCEFKDGEFQFAHAQGISIIVNVSGDKYLP